MLRGELGLGADADGILILPADTPLGAPLADIAGDVVLDVDVKPNRGDLLSMIGLAREVAAISGSKVRWPLIEVPESGDATNDHLWVEIADRSLCPRFVGRWVDQLAVRPSPFRVQLRLAAAGVRPVSNVVDASNFVMLELGKPIHTFDAAAVSGGQLVVRAARDGEMLETLDHVQRELTSDTLVIADSRGPIGIAGVMGGAQSEVGAGTTAVVIESAVFDAVSVRRTAFRYGLRSEASLRFEKGQESRLARLGADRTAQLLAEWAGARVATGVVDSNPADEEPRRVAFRPARVDRLLGTQLGADAMRAELARIGIDTAAGADGELLAVVPPHRRDIAIEEDVAEEVIRLHGYDTLTRRLPDTAMPAYRDDPRRLIDLLRDMLAGRGLTEVITNGLIGPHDHDALGISADDSATIHVENPVTVDHSQMRRSMLPGLVGVLARNERQRWPNVAMFEIGAIHEWSAGKPRQQELLGLLMAGELRPASWSESGREVSIDDAKGIVEVLVARLNVGPLVYRPAEAHAGVEHPGRTAEVRVPDGVLGRVGELHPAFLARYDIRAEHVAFATLDLDALRRLANSQPEVRNVYALPAIERDIAVVVDRQTPAADVEAVIRRHAGGHLARLELFDRYQGAPLEEGEVSLAYRLRFQPVEAPIAEAELDASIGEVSQALAREVGGRIRSGA